MGRRGTQALVIVAFLFVAACSSDEGGQDEASVTDGADSEAADQGTEPGAELDWSPARIRYVIPSDVGGSFDRQARGIQPMWQDRLGIELFVDNQPGGNNAVGSTIVAQEGQECEALLHFSLPSLAFSHLTQEVDYTYDDFYPLATIQIAPSVVMVANDSPYETFSDLIEDARARPGEVRASTPATTSPGHLGLLMIEEALGVGFNKVSYDGGGPSRIAVASGEVEFSHAPVFGALEFADELRFIAMHQDENQWTDVVDIPTIADEMGEDVGSVEALYFVLAHRECQENYPDRFELLRTTLEDTLMSEEYQASLEDLGEIDAFYFRSPDEAHELILDGEARVREIVEQYDDYSLVE